MADAGTAEENKPRMETTTITWETKEDQQGGGRREEEQVGKDQPEMEKTSEGPELIKLLRCRFQVFVVSEQ